MSKDKQIEAISLEQAAKLALEALGRLDGWIALRHGLGLTPQEKEVVTALREALAKQQAQQSAERGEPVATLYGTLPVYDKPAQQDLPDLITGALGVSRGTAYDMMREALAEQQEPMAWIERDMNCDDFDPDSVTCQKPDISSAGWEWVPLYTTPQAQPSQPLTDEETSKLFDSLVDEMLEHSYQGSHDSAEKAANEIRRMYKAAHGITKGNT